MWLYVICIALGIGSRLMGHEPDLKEALLVFLIFLVISFEQNREKKQS